MIIAYALQFSALTISVFPEIPAPAFGSAAYISRALFNIARAELIFAAWQREVARGIASPFLSSFTAVAFTPLSSCLWPSVASSHTHGFPSWYRKETRHYQHMETCFLID